MARIMAKKRHGAEQIIPKLREAEVELARGLKVPQVCKKLLVEAELDKAILREAASQAAESGQATASG